MSSSGRPISRTRPCDRCPTGQDHRVVGHLADLHESMDLAFRLRREVLNLRAALAAVGAAAATATPTVLTAEAEATFARVRFIKPGKAQP